MTGLDICAVLCRPELSSCLCISSRACLQAWALFSTQNSKGVRTCQQLVDGVHRLIIAAHAAAALLAQAIELVNEQDARRLQWNAHIVNEAVKNVFVPIAAAPLGKAWFNPKCLSSRTRNPGGTRRRRQPPSQHRAHRFAGFAEGVAHARGAHAHVDLHELGAAGREEWHAALARNRLRQQRLAAACMRRVTANEFEQAPHHAVLQAAAAERLQPSNNLADADVTRRLSKWYSTWRPDQQDACGGARAHGQELPRVAQEVHDLRDLRLHLQEGRRNVSMMPHPFGRSKE